jgi:hypothetical protein
MQITLTEITTTVLEKISEQAMTHLSCNTIVFMYTPCVLGTLRNFLNQLRQ